MARDSAARRALRGGSASYYRPPQKKGVSKRAILAVVLCFVLPPLGLLFMWVNQIFLTRGRFIMSGVAFLVMIIMLFNLLPSGTAVQSVPVASVPKLATPYPVDEQLTALSNMDDLLAGVELVRPTIAPTAEPEISQAPDEGMDIMQLTVYSVRSGAKYYHKTASCNGQTNRRSLTLQEAVNEGLSPCPKCDPVTE